jgi:hypothetical protein
MSARKRWWRMVAMLGLPVLLLPTMTLPASGQQNPVAALDPIQGLVQFRPADAPENDWRTISAAQLVGEGDWVRTDSLGQAELAFFEGNLTEILPNTLVKIAKFDFVDQDSPDVTIQVAVGDMRHQIDQALDAESRYEVDTPSAVITVRGTNFWSSATWLSESFASALQGTLEVAGIYPEGVLSPPVFVGQNQFLSIPSIGQPGPVIPLDPALLPDYPPTAPLAPATCGNLICDAGEDEFNCALDCRPFPTCGNGVCDLDLGEGPVTCAADCVPRFRLQEETTGGGPGLTGIPCTVQTSRGDVPVRVGPGFDRRIRYYLPPNVPIEVVGTFTDPQGNPWWKIHPPGFNPGEEDRYWVLNEDVDETGDCHLVPPADPSPVIAGEPVSPPIIPGGPTPTPPPPGTWGVCGSCDTCGYPGECVISPEGVCLWDPTTCGGGGPTCATLTTAVEPSGAGTVSVREPPNCGSGYTPGTSITMVATPAVRSGYTFVYWSVCGLSSKSNPITFTITSACAVVAYFN